MKRDKIKLSGKTRRYFWHYYYNVVNYNIVPIKKVLTFE